MKSSSSELGVSTSPSDTPPTLETLTPDETQMSRTRIDANTFLSKIQPKFENIFKRPTQCNSSFDEAADEIYEFKPDPGYNMLQLNVPEHQRSDPHLHLYPQMSQSAPETFAQSIHQAERMRSLGWEMEYHLEEREGLRNGDWAYNMSGTMNNETGNKQTYTRAGIEGGQVWAPQRSLFAWELTTETPDNSCTSQRGNGAYEVQLDSPLITVDGRGVPHKDDIYRAAIATSVEAPKVFQISRGSATKEVDSSGSTE